LRVEEWEGEGGDWFVSTSLSLFTLSSTLSLHLNLVTLPLSHLLHLSLQPVITHLFGCVVVSGRVEIGGEE
jgi:hypothetical protein